LIDLPKTNFIKTFLSGELSHHNLTEVIFLCMWYGLVLVCYWRFRGGSLSKNLATEKKLHVMWLNQSTSLLN